MVPHHIAQSAQSKTSASATPGQNVNIDRLHESPQLSASAGRRGPALRFCTFLLFLRLRDVQNQLVAFLNALLIAHHWKVLVSHFGPCSIIMSIDFYRIDRRESALLDVDIGLRHHVRSPDKPERWHKVLGGSTGALYGRIHKEFRIRFWYSNSREHACC